MKWKGGRRGLISVYNCVKEEELGMFSGGCMGSLRGMSVK